MKLLELAGNVKVFAHINLFKLSTRNNLPLSPPFLPLLITIPQLPPSPVPGLQYFYLQYLILSLHAFTNGISINWSFLANSSCLLNHSHNLANDMITAIHFLSSFTAVPGKNPDFLLCFFNIDKTSKELKPGLKYTKVKV